LLTIGLLLSFALAAYAQEQTPLILDVSTVVAGAQRIETMYVYAVGKWSDANAEVSVNSTQIHCYKTFGFCEVASADTLGVAGGIYVNLDSFDVLRWDGKELIAVDSSPICVVNTLRMDFSAMKVTMSSTSKGATKDHYCKDIERLPTVFLGGMKDAIKQK